MELYFNYLNIKTYFITGFLPEHKIVHLKLMLMHHLDNYLCAKKDLYLSFGRKILEDDRTLAEYNI